MPHAGGHWRDTLKTAIGRRVRRTEIHIGRPQERQLGASEKRNGGRSWRAGQPPGHPGERSPCPQGATLGGGRLDGPMKVGQGRAWQRSRRQARGLSGVPDCLGGKGTEEVKSGARAFTHNVWDETDSNSHRRRSNAQSVTTHSLPQLHATHLILVRVSGGEIPT